MYGRRELEEQCPASSINQGSPFLTTTGSQLGDSLFFWGQSKPRCCVWNALTLEPSNHRRGFRPAEVFCFVPVGTGGGKFGLIWFGLVWFCFGPGRMVWFGLAWFALVGVLFGCFFCLFVSLIDLISFDLIG